MINCTSLFTAQLIDLERAVRTSRAPADATPAVRQGYETRSAIVDALRTHGPMTVAETARRIDRTRACVNVQMQRLAAEKPPRVRRLSDGYNAQWEAA